MNSIKIVWILLLMWISGFSFPAYGQLTQPGQPLTGLKSFDKKDFFVSMPGLNPDTLKNIQERERDKKYKTFRFAYTFDVDFSPENSGMWDTLPDGTRLWRLGIASENAHSLNIIFNPYHVPRGCKLFVYNEDKSFVIGALTHKNNKASGVLPVSPVPGERLIIEYQVPAGVSETGELVISKVNHDYKDVFKYLKLKDANYGKSGDCNIDIKCPLGNDWQDVKNAVCRLLITGKELCSGALVNNTNYDGKPYVLTANHCVTTESKANNSIFYFNYESPYCNGPDGSVKHNISTASLKATTSKLDFSLVELSEKPPFSFSPFYAGWNADGTKPSSTVTIHHPLGDVKKISKDNDEPITANFGSGYDFQSHWKIIEWDKGVTEGGSSGGPLFNMDQQIIGDLTGGDAKCSNPVNDYFAKFSNSWDDYEDINAQLKCWLDPQGLGVLSISGFDPYAEVKEGCDTLRNIFSSENEVVYQFSDPGWGTWSGQNSEGYKAYAEQFFVDYDRDLAGMFIHFEKAYNSLSFATITLKVWDGKSLPESVVYSEDILIRDIREKSWNFYGFDSAVRVADTFFVGYEIYYRTFMDTISVYQAANRGAEKLKTAYIKNDNKWYSFDGLIAGDFSTSYAIRVVSCLEIPDMITEPEKDDTKENIITIYPNPVYDIIHVNYHSDKQANNIHFGLFNLNGLQVMDKTIHLPSDATIDLGGLPPGIYIAKINTGNELVTKKVLIIR